MDALSKAANQRGPKKVWASSFAGVTLGSPAQQTNYFWRKAINGTDTLTGHEFTADTSLRNFFGSDASIDLWHISYTEALFDIADFNSYFTTAINSSTALSKRTGAGELSLTNLISSASASPPDPGPSQTPLMLTRGNAAAIANDRREYYFAGTYMFPASMALDAAGKYKTFFEIKSGCLLKSLVDAVESGAVRDGSSCASASGNGSYGTFRLYLEINGSGGINNEIRVKIDDNARNGTLTGGAHAPNAYWDEAGYHSVAYAGGSVFHVHKRTGVSVPLGVPVRFHIWLKKPPTPLYRDRPLGVLKVMMENLSTNEVAMLCDIHDSYEAQLCSSFNEVDTRMFWTTYDALPDLELKMTDLQIWENPPIRF